jgi:hypothetical protein
MTRTGFKPIHSSKLVGRMVNGVPKGTKSYIAAKTAELKEEKAKKKVISLNAEQLYTMSFDVEWDLADKTHELIKVLKAQPEQDYEKAMSIVDKLENLLDKRMNILSAQMLIDDMEKK